MERTPRILLAILFALALAGCGSGDVSPNGGSTATLPVTELPPDDPNFVDHSSAMGFYSSGSLKDATSLPPEAPGLLKIFRLRNRGYATDTMIRTIEFAAATVHSLYPQGERLQVGDTADSNGGFLSGHASHQNGLDADILYFRNNHVEENPDTTGPDGFHEIFVKSGKVTANFDVTRNWAILKALVSRGNVNRVFVDPVIKKTFCNSASAVDPGVSDALKTETLRRLRPYANHDNHFHLRIQCPVNHTHCEKQDDPPAGSGCSSIAASEGNDGFAGTTPADPNDDLGEDEF